jgi:hypothetical protein
MYAVVLSRIPALTLVLHQGPATTVQKGQHLPVLIPVPLGGAEQLTTDVASKATQVLIVRPDQRRGMKVLIDPNSDKVLETGSVVTASCVGTFLELLKQLASEILWSMVSQTFLSMSSHSSWSRPPRFVCSHGSARDNSM